MAWKMSAAKRRALVKLQLRDKNGRWIEMGRGVKWYSSKRKKEIGGTVVGSQGNYALVRLNKENPTHEPALVKVPARHIEVVSSKATLSDPKAPKSNLETPEFEKPEAVAKADVDLADGPQAVSPATIMPNLSDTKDDYSISDTADGNTYLSRKDGEQLYFPARGLEVGDELIAPEGADETKPFSIGKGWATKGAERLNPNGPKLGKVISVEGDRYAVVQMAGGHTVDDKKNPGEQTDTVTVGLTNRVIKATPGLKEALGDKISNEVYAERGEDEQEIDPDSPEAQSDHEGREVPEDQQDQPELPPLEDDEDEYKETLVTVKATGHTLEEIKFAMETADGSGYDHGIRMRENGKMEIYDLDGAITALQGPLDVILDNYDPHTGKYEGRSHTPRQANAIKNGLEKIINHLTDLKGQQAEKEANNPFLNGYDIDKDFGLGKVRKDRDGYDYIMPNTTSDFLENAPIGTVMHTLDETKRDAFLDHIKVADNRWVGPGSLGSSDRDEFKDAQMLEQGVEQGVRLPGNPQNDYTPEEIAQIIANLDRGKASIERDREDFRKNQEAKDAKEEKPVEEPVTDEPVMEEPEVPETPAETPEDPSEPSQTVDPTVAQIKKGLAQLDQDVEDIENHDLSDEDRAAAIEEARFSFADANGEQWTLAAVPEGEGEWSYNLVNQQGENKASLLPAKYENYDQLAEAIASSVNSTVARNNAEQDATENPAEPEAPKEEPLNANGLTEEEQKNADAYVRMAARAENQGKFEQADRLTAQLDELMKKGEARKAETPAEKPQEPAGEPESTPVEPEPVETPEEAPVDVPALIEPDEPAAKPELPPLAEGEELELPIPGVKKQGKRADKSAQHLKTLDGLEEGDRVSHTNAHDETSTYQKHPDGTWDLLDPEGLNDEDVSPLEEAIAASDLANRHKRGDLVVETVEEREEAERVEARAAKERAKGYKPIPTKPIDKSQPTGKTRAEEDETEANSADKPWSPEDIASSMRDWFDFAQAVKNGDSRAIETMAQRKRTGDEETDIIVNDKGQPFDLTLTYNDDGDPVVRISNFDDSKDIYGDFDIDTSVMPKQLSTLIHEAINADDVAAAITERNGSADKELDKREEQARNTPDDETPEETTPEVPEETPAEEATPEEVTPEETAPEEVAPEEVSTPARGEKLKVADGEEHPLDRLGVERRTPEAVGDEKYAPTQQQQDVIDSVLGGLDTLVQAKAGSGKTTTLQAIATRVLKDRPDDQILYVAFNKTVQEEAKERMPSNVEPRTGHSISFNWVPTKMRNRFKDKEALQLPEKVAKHLGISGRGEYKADDMASDVMTIVGRYSFSADDEVGLQHIPDFLEEKDPKTKAALVEYAKKAWADIIDHDNGKLKVEQDHMRKLWALSRPDFSKLGGGVKPSQIVFIDEAQDTPPVLAKVIADQKIQKVVVGDADQAIYGFTGATDYLSQAKGDIELPLNMSWRFGPEVASVGNRFLELLESDGRVVGGGPSSEIVTNMEDADAILVRSNSGMLAEIIRELERGRVVGISEKTMTDMRALIASARWLKFGADPKWKPSNLHEKLAPYRSWEEVSAASAKGGDQSLTSLKNMVDEYGVGRLKELMDKVVIDKKLEEVPEGGKFLDKLTFTSTNTETTVDGKPWDTVAAKEMLKQVGFRYLSTGEKYEKGDKKGQFKKAWQAVGTPEEQEAMVAAFRKLDSPEGAEENYVKPDVIVSTAHKAKGLEWDRVRIGDDFWQPKVDEETGEMIEMVSDDELRLAYVAVTRAQKALDVGSLGYVYQYTSENGGSPKTEAPAEPREDEDQPTSLEPDTTPEDHSVKNEEETGFDQPVEPTVPEEPAESEPAEPSQPVNVGLDLDFEGLTPAERRHAEGLEERVADVYRGNSDEDVKELENELFDLYRTGLLRNEGEDIPEVQPKAEKPAEAEPAEPEVIEPEVVEPVEEPVEVPVEEPVVEEPVKVQPPAPVQTEEPEFDDEGLTPAERQRADELEQFIYDIFRGRGQGNRKALEKELEGIYSKGQERLRPKAAQKSKPVAPKPAETTPETPETKPETPTVPEETEAERTARTRRNFSDSDRVVIGGDGSEIRANTTGIHRKLGKIEIVEVQPGAGRLKFKDPVTGKIKSTDASFVTADTDETVETSTPASTGDAFLPADTPVNTIIFDPEQQKEVFISANKQKVAPQGRVRHSKKGEGTVRAIYPGADGMGSIRVMWDDGSDSRVKGTTLEGLDSPSLLSGAGEGSVSKKIAETFAETEAAKPEPQTVPDSDIKHSYDAPSLPSQPFIGAEIMMIIGDHETDKGTKNPWDVAGKMYSYLLNTPTGDKDLDGFKKKLVDGVTYVEARNYAANLKSVYQKLYNINADPNFRDAVKALDLVVASIDEKLADPADTFNPIYSSARYNKPLPGWERTDLIMSTKDKNDPLRIMEESVIQDSYRSNTVVSMVDDSGKLLATFQKNAQGNWVHRDNTGAVAMVMPGSFPVNPNAKYMVDENTGDFGSKSTQKPFVRSQFWNNLPVGARVEGAGLSGTANFVKVRDGLWKNERGFYAVINDLVRPTRILEAEGIEIEEVRPVGEDNFGSVANGTSRSKLLYDAPEGSQFSYVNSPESVFVKEAGLWTERVSGVRTGKTFGLASAEPDLTKDGSPDIIVRLPNGLQVADLIDPSLDESKFDIDTYDGQDVSFSNYEFETSKFNPASVTAKINGIKGKSNDIFAKLNGNTFYNGQRVFDKNLKYLGKIGAIINYGDDETQGRINVIGTGGSAIEDRGGVWYTLKDVKRMGLLSEGSPKYRDDEINYDTVSVFDIQRALQKKYPGMTFQFTGLDVESAKEYARTVERMLAKFPQLRHSLHKITSEDFGDYAAGAVAINRADNWGARSVAFNSKHFDRKSWKQGVQRMGQRGQLIKHPEGREMEYMMTHEFGHVIDYLTGNIDEGRILELISKALGRKVTQNNKSLRDELLRKKLVSEYSTRGTASFSHMNKGKADDIHVVELVAESFADVEVNGTNASPISKVIHKELMDKLKEY